VYRTKLFSAIGAPDPKSSTIKFDTTDVKPRLPYHVAFQNKLVYNNRTMASTVVDEGASTCVMSLSCWQAIGSSELFKSPTLLTAFDGRSFRPHGIIPSFPVQLAGKTVSVEVEVVDAPLDYNLLLGRSWTYAMTAVVSSVFRVLCFPHEGKVIMVDQVFFHRPSNAASSGSTVPLIKDSHKANEGPHRIIKLYFLRYELYPIPLVWCHPPCLN